LVACHLFEKRSIIPTYLAIPPYFTHVFPEGFQNREKTNPGSDDFQRFYTIVVAEDTKAAMK
jgi:hypothetical protein